MEEYPKELRRPPVALACLVGCPELHPLSRRTFTLSSPDQCPDFSKISVIPPKKPPRETSDAISGILKRDWLSKHRTRILAVVAAIFSSRDVSGDPAQWLEVCTPTSRPSKLHSVAASNKAEQYSNFSQNTLTTHSWPHVPHIFQDGERNKRMKEIEKQVQASISY